MKIDFPLPLQQLPLPSPPAAAAAAATAAAATTTDAAAAAAARPGAASAAGAAAAAAGVAAAARGGGGAAADDAAAITKSFSLFSSSFSFLKLIYFINKKQKFILPAEQPLHAKQQIIYQFAAPPKEVRKYIFNYLLFYLFV